METDECVYTTDAHHTKEANAYHMEKCVTDWMKRMTNTEECVEYMAGIGQHNSNMGECSVDDLIDICTSKRDNFTIDDANMLCTELNKGHARFWSKRHFSAAVNDSDSPNIS